MANQKHVKIRIITLDSDNKVKASTLKSTSFKSVRSPIGTQWSKATC